MLKHFIHLKAFSIQGKIMHRLLTLICSKNCSKFNNYCLSRTPRVLWYRCYSWERSQVKIDKSERKKTLYEVLELPSIATQSEIKAAYYELSMLYHPDKNPSEQANETFTELTKAYEVLGNLNSRREYDKEIGTYYTLRSQSKKKDEKVLRLTEEISIELDAKTVYESGVFLRTCAPFSYILDLSFRVNNLRLYQRPQGAQPRDITIMMLIRSLCDATLTAHLGGTQVSLLPGEKKTGTFSAQRFPSIAFYTALPCLAFAPRPSHTNASRLVLKGTTHGHSSPQIDYMELVYKPIIEKFGLQFSLDIKKRAFQPYKEGTLVLRVPPVKTLQPISLRDPGELKKISGKVYVAGAKPVKIAQVLEKLAVDLLKEKYPGVDINIVSLRERNGRSAGMGQGVMLIGETSTGCLLCGCSLWNKGMSHEQTVFDSIKMLEKRLLSGTCVDDALQEMLIVPMALADGRSVVRVGSVTATAQAAIIAAEVMCDAKFHISKYVNNTGGESVVLTCEGIGHRNPDFLEIAKKHVRN